MVSVKTTRRALFTSILALLVCVSMLVGTSFAWFTDSVTSGVNKIIAGNLDVDVKYYDDGTGAFTNSITGVDNIFQAPAGETTGLWEPGHVEVAYLRVENQGTLALKYKIAIDPYNEIGGTNVKDEAFLLSNYLQAAIVDYTVPYANRGDALLAATAPGASAGDLSALMDLANQTPVSLDPKGGANASKAIAIIIYMPETVGNDANYKTGTPAPRIDFAISVVAGQDTVENDSWDNQYDASAALDAELSTVILTGVVDNTGKLSIAGANAGAEVSGLTPDDAYLLTVEETNDSPAVVTVNSGTESAYFEITLTNTTTGDEESKPGTYTYNIGAGLTITEVNHRTTPLTTNPSAAEYYAYDPATGILELHLASLSPFSVGYVAPEAKIGSTYYPTLVDALDAAADGDTVVLLSDADVLDAYELTKTITINGNGHTVRASNQTGGYNSAAEGRVFNITENSQGITVTMNDLSIVGESTGVRGISCYGSTDVTLLLNHCDIWANYYAINIASSNIGFVFEANDSTCSTGWCAVQSWSADAQITFNDCTLSGLNNKPYNADGWNNFGTVVVNGGATGNVWTFNNCTIKADQTTGNKQWAFVLKDATEINLNNTKILLDGVEVSSSIEPLYEADGIAFTSQAAIDGLVYVVDGVTEMP